MAAARPPEPSLWAKRYYETVNGHSILTPWPDVISLDRPVQHKEQRDMAEKYQKGILAGFTTRELTDLNALSERELRASTLPDAISPLLRRCQWDQQGTLFRRTTALLIDGRDRRNRYGNWKAKNDVVWDALLPSLKIATQYLMSPSALSWINALLLGPRTAVDGIRNPEQRENLLEFGRGRSPLDIDSAVQARDRFFIQQMIRKYDILFSFFQPGREPWSDRAIDHQSQHGTIAFTNCRWSERTPGDGMKQNVVIWLNITHIRPLIVDRNLLSDAELNGISWMLGLTIAHELMHAMNKIKDRPDRDERDYSHLPVWEPYFEDEGMSELGFAFENAVNGGLVQSMLTDEKARGHPLGFWLMTPWPSMHVYDVYNNSLALQVSPLLEGIPPVESYILLFPILITVYEDSQSSDFWQLIVRKYGQKTLYYQTMKAAVGSRQVCRLRSEDVNEAVISGRVNLSPWNNEPRTFVEAMERIRNASKRTSGENRILSIADDMFGRWRFGELIWQDRQTQRQNINTFFELIGKGLQSNRDDEDDYKVRLFEVLMQATTKHLEIVEHQIRLDQINQALPDLTLRRNLLLFSRAMRTTIEQLKSRWIIDARALDQTIRFNTILNYLEKAMMMLLVRRGPGGAPRIPRAAITVDHIELDNIDAAHAVYLRGDADECREIINRINRATGNSSLVITCCALLEFALRDPELEDRETRFYTWRLIRQYHRRMLYISNSYKGDTREWIDLLRRWTTFASDLATRWRPQNEGEEAIDEMESDLPITGEDAPPYMVKEVNLL